MADDNDGLSAALQAAFSSENAATGGDLGELIDGMASATTKYVERRIEDLRREIDAKIDARLKALNS